MTTMTLNGITYDSNNLTGTTGRGYAADQVNGDGETMDYWIAWLYDGLADLNNGGVTTSSSSVAIGTGSKSFTLAANVPLAVGVNVKIFDRAAPSTNNMFGAITAINNTVPANPVITVNVTDINGSGTLSDWDVVTRVGDIGPTGATGGGLADVVDDTSPQLGGNLDANGFRITNMTATTSVQGVVEYATAAEINTGTDITRAVSAAELSDSNYGLGKFVFHIPNPSVGDGALYLQPVAEAAGEIIVDARAYWAGVIGTGAATSVQLHNETQSLDVFSTNLTIDSGERSSQTAATPVVINTSNDDITLNDIYRVDIDAVGSTVEGTNLVIEIFTRIP